MADDSNLIEFSLHDESTATTSEATPSSDIAANSHSASVDQDTERHIDAIIANAMRKGVSPQAKMLITQYWKPCLVQTASEHGTSGFLWRDSVKKLTNLSLFLEPEVNKTYPQVAEKLLPDLLSEMQQAIANNNVADAGLATLIDSLQGKTTIVDTPSDTTTTANMTPELKEPEFASETMSVDDTMADVSLDIDDNDQSEIPEFELDEADAFDFDLSDEVSSNEDADVNELSFDLPDEPSLSKPQEKPQPEKVSKPQTTSFDDELPPLDLEPFKDDK